MFSRYGVLKDKDAPESETGAEEPLSTRDHSSSAGAGFSSQDSVRQLSTSAALAPGDLMPSCAFHGQLHTRGATNSCRNTHTHTHVYKNNALINNSPIALADLKLMLLYADRKFNVFVFSQKSLLQKLNKSASIQKDCNILLEFLCKEARSSSTRL